jgi:hypothetical protein
VRSLRLSPPSKKEKENTKQHPPHRKTKSESPKSA